MTLADAITALLEEYRLEDFVDAVRDEVRGDDSFAGLSWDHPRVTRFREACAALRAAQREASA